MSTSVRKRAMGLGVENKIGVTFNSVVLEKFGCWKKKEGNNDRVDPCCFISTFLDHLESIN